MTKPPLDAIGKVVYVLDVGWIEFTDMMPNPILGRSGDMAIVNAARTSRLRESKGEEADKNLLFYLMTNRHTTPFGMVEFKFRVYLHLFVRDQWVRHRTWSYNIQSLRYSKPKMDFYHPEDWRLQNTVNKQGSDGIVDDKMQEAIVERLWVNTLIDARTYIGSDLGALQSHFEGSGETFYNALIEAGVTREQARMFIPVNTYTTMVAKVDAHNLMRFLKLRLHPHAQWEIRQYAEAIYQHCFKPLLPWTAEAFEKFMLEK